MKPEVGKQQNEGQEPFRHCDQSEGQDLAQQKFVRRDARNIDLQDRLLLAFFGHGERGEQCREHRKSHDERSGCVKLLRVAPRVEPQPDIGLYGRSGGPVIRHHLACIAQHELRRVGVRRVHQKLHLGVRPARHVAAEMFGNHQRRSGCIRQKGIRRLPPGRPCDNVKRQRSAKRVDEITGGRGIVEILHHDRQTGDRQRDGTTEQHQQTQRQYQR